MAGFWCGDHGGCGCGCGGGGGDGFTSESGAGTWCWRVVEQRRASPQTAPALLFRHENTAQTINQDEGVFL